MGGGNVHKPGPPGHPTHYYLLHQFIMNKAIETSERWKLVQFLVIEQGVDVDSLSPSGSSPFLLSAQEGYLDICTFLEEKGSEPYLPRKDMINALHIAVKYGPSGRLSILGG